MSAAWSDQPAPDAWAKWATTDEFYETLRALPEPGPDARECRMDHLYHEAISWATASEPNPARRALLVREAHTSPEVAAAHAYSYGYAQACEDCAAEVADATASRDALGIHYAALTRAHSRRRASRRQRSQRSREAVAVVLGLLGLGGALAVLWVVGGALGALRGMGGL